MTCLKLAYITVIVNRAMFTKRQTIRGIAANLWFGTRISSAPALLVGAVSASCAIGSEVIDLAAAGVSPDNDPRVNRANFQRAVSRARVNATLYLPPTGTRACVIDTSGGWRQAVQIDRPLALRIDGNIRASHSAVRPNPPFILNVTAPGTILAGSGQIIGDGRIDDANRGTDETMPGLVRVAADDFSMTGIAMVNPPKVGLMLYQCRRARIHAARFSGGPTVYSDTGHFAIRAAGGGGHTFESNRFYPASDGGMAVQCIMLVGSHDNVVVGNHALHPFEKLIYAYGDRNLARGNIVEGYPAYIPGTNVEGTYTAVIRFHGSNNRVEQNRTTRCAGGVQMMDGTGHIVIGNEFLKCGQSAITAYQSDLSNSVFRDNVGTRGSLSGFLAGNGMHLVSNRGWARNVLLENNRISGFSVADPIAAIETWEASRIYGRNSLVKPSARNGRYYVAVVTGSSGGSEPRWTNTLDRAVRDANVMWAAMAFEGQQAEIVLAGSSITTPVVDSVIRHNEAGGGGPLGIVTRFVAGSRITGNRIEASTFPMVDESGRRNLWESNTVRGAPSSKVRFLAAGA